MPKTKIPQPFSGRKFQGILLQPIDNPDVIMFAIMSALRTKKKYSIVELNRLEKMYVKEQTDERLYSLAVHYGVFGLLGVRQPGWEKELLLRLANDFVVGFTTVQQNRKPIKGPKKKPLDYELAIHIFEVMKTAKTATNSCRLISKDKKSRWHNKRPKSLLEKFNRIKTAAKREVLAGPAQTPFEKWLRDQ
jgi:hypothetical protein